jgi:hypothetical protein
LPSIDDPRLNFQFVGGEPLDAQPIKKPGRIGRYVRRLVGPVIEVVVTEETDVGNEDTRVHVEPVVHIEVVAAVGFSKILVGAT